MATLYMLQTGGEAWGESMRLPSNAGQPVSDAQREQAGRTADELAGLDIRAIYGSPAEPGSKIARLVGKRLGLRAGRLTGLHEIDYGLWQGLLVGEVKRRHGKAYRRWLEAPETACPPGGEAFAQALDRAWAALCKIVKRHRGHNFLLVVSPLIAALLDCRIMGRSVGAVWDAVDWSARLRSYDLSRIGILEAVR